MSSRTLPRWLRIGAVCLILILSLTTAFACTGGSETPKDDPAESDGGSTETKKYVKIYFDDENGNKTSKSLLTTATLEEPPDPVKEGYTFLGWYLKDQTDPYDFGQPVGESSFTLYAHWELIPVEVYHKVSYYYNDGTDLILVGTQQVSESAGFTAELLTQRDEMRYEGFGFGSYYSDKWKNNRVNFKSPVKSDLTIYCSRDDLAGTNVHWTYSQLTKTLMLTGTGDMYDFAYSTSVPWNNLALLVNNIIVAEGITSIGDCSFYGFKGISEVTLPNTVVRIGENAFYQSSITEINFPDSLRTIERCAFQQCQNIVHLNFNPGLSYIGKAAFYECSNIRTAVLTDTIGELGGSAFQNTTSLTTVYYIGTEEQYNKIVVRLSNFWVTDLSRTYFLHQDEPDAPGAYWYYDEEGEIAQWYYTVWYMENRSAKLPAFRDFISTKDGASQANIEMMNTMYHGYRFAGWKNANNQNFTLTVGQKFNQDFRVYGVRGNLCGENLTYSLTNYKGKRTLSINGTGPMWDFEGLSDAPWLNEASTVTEIVIGSGVTYIGSNAFNNFSAVELLNIPTNITAVSKNMISNCAPLKYILYQGEKSAFAKVTNLDCLENVYDAVVYVHSPAGEDPGEGNFWRVMSRTEGTDRMTKTVTWSLKDGELTLGCSDPTMFNYLSAADTPWYAEKDNITSVVVRSGIMVLGHNTVNGFANVTQISLPATLTRISASALAGTAYYNDTAHYDEYGVLYIDHHLIRAMTPNQMPALYTIPKYTLSIAENAFAGCSNVKELIFSEEMDEIYSTGMSGLTELETIYFNSAYSVWEAQKGRENICSYDKIYFYSFTKPTDTEHLYWHYSEDSLPVIWDVEAS